MQDKSPADIGRMRLCCSAWQLRVDANVEHLVLRVWPPDDALPLHRRYGTLRSVDCTAAALFRDESQPDSHNRRHLAIERSLNPLPACTAPLDVVSEPPSAGVAHAKLGRFIHDLSQLPQLHSLSLETLQYKVPSNNHLCSTNLASLLADGAAVSSAPCTAWRPLILLPDALSRLVELQHLSCTVLEADRFTGAGVVRLAGPMTTRHPRDTKHAIATSRSPGGEYGSGGSSSSSSSSSGAAEGPSTSSHPMPDDFISETSAVQRENRGGSASVTSAPHPTTVSYTDGFPKLPSLKSLQLLRVHHEWLSANHSVLVGLTSLALDVAGVEAHRMGSGDAEHSGTRASEDVLDALRPLAPHLRRLQLSGLHLRRADSLLKLGVLTALSHLDLASNWIGGVEPFAQLSVGLTGLKTLILAGNRSWPPVDLANGGGGGGGGAFAVNIFGGGAGLGGGGGGGGIGGALGPGGFAGPFGVAPGGANGGGGMPVNGGAAFGGGMGGALGPGGPFDGAAAGGANGGGLLPVDGGAIGPAFGVAHDGANGGGLLPVNAAPGGFIGGGFDGAAPVNDLGGGASHVGAALGGNFGDSQDGGASNAANGHDGGKQDVGAAESLGEGAHGAEGGMAGGGVMAGVGGEIPGGLPPPAPPVAAGLPADPSGTGGLFPPPSGGVDQDPPPSTLVAQPPAVPDVKPAVPLHAEFGRPIRVAANHGGLGPPAASSGSSAPSRTVGEGRPSTDALGGTADDHDASPQLLTAQKPSAPRAIHSLHAAFGRAVPFAPFHGSLRGARGAEGVALFDSAPHHHGNGGGNAIASGSGSGCSGFSAFAGADGLPNTASPGGLMTGVESPALSRCDAPQVLAHSLDGTGVVQSALEFGEAECGPAGALKPSGAATATYIAVVATIGLGTVAGGGSEHHQTIAAYRHAAGGLGPTPPGSGGGGGCAGGSCTAVPYIHGPSGGKGTSALEDADPLGSAAAAAAAAAAAGSSGNAVPSAATAPVAVMALAGPRPELPGAEEAAEGSHGGSDAGSSDDSSESDAAWSRGMQRVLDDDGGGGGGEGTDCSGYASSDGDVAGAERITTGGIPDGASSTGGTGRHTVQPGVLHQPVVLRHPQAGLASGPDSTTPTWALEHLDVSGCFWSAVHAEHAMLESCVVCTTLQVLKLDMCHMLEVPSFVSQLVRLRVLDLARNRLTAIPACLRALPLLEDLNLAGNRLHADDGGNWRVLRRLKSVTSLNVACAATPEECDVTQLACAETPEECDITQLLLPADRLHADDGGNWRVLRRLKNLTSLNVASNTLLRLPPPLRGISGLVHLDISQNLMMLDNEALALMTKLETLDISRNRLASGRLDWLSHMVRLRSLEAADTHLSVLPAGLSRLSDLASLSISGCKMGHLPAGLCHLTGLTSLVLADFQLALVPPDIDVLRCLEDLDISFCPLQPGQQPPDALWRLAALRRLWVSEQLHARFGRRVAEAYPALRSLHIGSTKVGRVPPTRRSPPVLQEQQFVAGALL